MSGTHDEHPVATINSSDRAWSDRAPFSIDLQISEAITAIQVHTK